MPFSWLIRLLPCAFALKAPRIYLPVCLKHDKLIVNILNSHCPGSHDLGPSLIMAGAPFCRQSTGSASGPPGGMYFFTIEKGGTYPSCRRSQEPSPSFSEGEAVHAGRPSVSGRSASFYSRQPLQMSIHAEKPEYFSSSAMDNSMALLLLPQAGKTVSNRFRELSR